MHVLFVVLSVMLVIGGYDLFPLEFQTLPLHLDKEPWLKRDYAFRGRNGYKNVYVSPCVFRDKTVKKGLNFFLSSNIIIVIIISLRIEILIVHKSI